MGPQAVGEVGNGAQGVNRSMPLAYRVVILQAVVVALVAMLVMPFGGAPASALAGGICIVVPNAWMARRAAGTAAPGREMESAAGLYLALFIKLGLTIGLMALALARMEEIDGPAFFAGLLAALAGHHGSLLLAGDVVES